MLVDAEVSRLKVGGLEEDLAELRAEAEVGREEAVFNAYVVVVGSSRLRGEALTAAGGRFEANGACSAADEGMHAEDVAGVGDVAEGVLAGGVLDAAEGC